MKNNNRPKSEEELKEAIFEEKARGLSDIKIGKKFGVTLKFIEKIVTQKKGVNISNLNKNKKIDYLAPLISSLKIARFGVLSSEVIGRHTAGNIEAIIRHIFPGILSCVIQSQVT